MANQTVLDGEIAVGLVLHLDPDRLLADGGTCTCGDKERVQGPHFFACVSRDPKSKTGVWVPFFGDTGTDRVEVAASEKTGHPKWTKGVTYYHPTQTWTVPDAAIEPAARAGKDASRQGSRNRLKKAADVLNAIQSFVAAQQASEGPAG
jgi:hypothetical protein